MRQFVLLSGINNGRIQTDIITDMTEWYLQTGENELTK